MVVVVFYRNKSLRRSMHCFIVNIAVSNLIIPIVVLPQLIVRAYNDGVLIENRVLASIVSACICRLGSIWRCFHSEYGDDCS